MTQRVKNALFFSIRDGELSQAKKLISDSALAALLTHYKRTDQSTLFFAAARQHGQDEDALVLCSMLLERGVPINHVDVFNQSALFYAAREGHADTIKFLIQKGADPNLRDKNGETAIYYAVSEKRVEAVKALVEGGANLEVVNNSNDTLTSSAPTELLPTLEEARKKRRRFEDSGPGPKRQRTVLEELRSWADEWPIKEKVLGDGPIRYKEEDVVREDSAAGYVVIKNVPTDCAARLRVSEKHFVVDHAELLQGEAWFKDLAPEDWCKTVGVIADEAKSAVSAIKTVVSGKLPHHFTLPLVETQSKKIAGYVHAAHTPEKKEMDIVHIKVDAAHRGQGLGGLLIEAAEDYSHELGWSCAKTCLSVLKANARAQRCYVKAGFKFQSSRAACWGAKQHPGSKWQRWRKVHKHHTDKKGKKIEKQ
eukprot:Skav234328  [mRNA]  locus=scaffold3161:139241:140509:+ [translate_table: standard]